MDTLLVIWIVFGALLVIGTIFSAGYSGETMSSHDKEETIFYAFVFAITWPALIAFAITGAIVVAPFYGIYFLGKYLGKRYGK